MNLQHFIPYTKQTILDQTHVRKFETKMGEVVQTPQPGLPIIQELDQSTADYVIFGVPEDIGVQANLGTAGTSTAWAAFLQSFVNLQSNDFLEGTEVLLLGYFDFAPVQELVNKTALNSEERTDAYRHAVHAIDEAVEGLVKAIVAAGKIPIVIGGGHNNAYPCLKGAAKGLNQAGLIPLPQINAINLDANSGYRPAEGRHSGNAFRYAEEDGFLQKYCMLALQETALSQNVWLDIVNNPFMDCITYEDMFVRCQRSFRQAVEHAIGFTDDNYVGIELDMDVVQDAWSGGYAPGGVQPAMTRQYVQMAASMANPAYLHIAEGIARLQNGTVDEHVGKLIAYLVADFIKGMEEERD